jgi:hypothetical protein
MDRKTLYETAFATAYVNQYLKHMDEGRGCPVDDDSAGRIAEESQAIAEEVLEHYRPPSNQE